MGKKFYSTQGEMRKAYNSLTRKSKRTRLSESRRRIWGVDVKMSGVKMFKIHLGHLSDNRNP
jgi:hypothetical protein